MELPDRRKEEALRGGSWVGCRRTCDRGGGQRWGEMEEDDQTQSEIKHLVCGPKVRGA